MATSREIKNRIQSVTNTRKITRTMELVSTAKAKKAVDRVNAAKPYSEKVQELIATLGQLEIDGDFPLLRQVDAPKTAVVILISANRGLCGGYNNNIIKEGLNRIEELKKNGVKTRVILVGKKATGFFKFQKLDFEKSITDIDDNIKFNDVVDLINSLIAEFKSGKLDLVDVAFTRYISAGNQAPQIYHALPLVSKDAEQSEDASTASSAILEPSPEQILESLLPRAIRTSVFQTFLDSMASEQIARRIAMKNATEAASDMIKEQTLLYNRARQSKITQEIAEIVGGAAASE